MSDPPPPYNLCNGVRIISILILEVKVINFKFRKNKYSLLCITGSLHAIDMQSY